MKRANIAFATFLGLLFLLAALDALSFPWLARLFPLVVGSFGFGFCLVEIARLTKVEGTPPRGEAAEGEEQPGFRTVLPYLLWLAGYYGAVWVLGFLLATGLYLVTFLRAEARMSWLSSFLGAGAMVAVVLILGEAMSLHWPQGELGRWAGRPLP